ncbi:RagB/SusD family nutrient uptake outer membrane protein, partial [Parapusillimonas sp. SGNA-6]|nr:RagB/SusD family nutrient uptake outer membrane protein [Parapusillimonas sp. SGNA-6]
YITEPTAEVNIPQTPPKEVYQNIIADMEVAESLVLPIREIGHGGRVSKSAVRGVLARVNLYMAGNPVKDETRYSEARKWAKMVIDDTDAAHALNPDFSQIFINYASDEYDVAESIWEIEFWGNHQDSYREGGQIGVYNGIRYVGGDPNYGRSEGQINATGALWEKYEAPGQLTSPDLRRDWTIAPFSVSGNPAVETPRSIEQIYQRNNGKFRRRNYEVVLPRDGQYSPINFPVLRFSDVLLMFAEADNYVNKGPSVDAYLAVNRVRRRGYGFPDDIQAPGVDLAGLDQADFLEELQDERSRELAFEILRKGDLVRWGIFMKKMTAARDHIEQAGLTSSYEHALRYFRNASARDVIWPIPAYERGMNPELKQNIGW